MAAPLPDSLSLLLPFLFLFEWRLSNGCCCSLLRVRPGSEQREGLDRMFASNKEAMDRYMAESGVDPKDVFSENPPRSPVRPHLPKSPCFFFSSQGLLVFFLPIICEGFVRRVHLWCTNIGRCGNCSE